MKQLPDIPSWLKMGSIAWDMSAKELVKIQGTRQVGDRQVPEEGLVIRFVGITKTGDPIIGSGYRKIDFWNMRDPDLAPYSWHEWHSVRRSRRLTFGPGGWLFRTAWPGGIENDYGQLEP